ncbi:NAD(P)/FAD-dependent oxidoreductase [Spartinivicinus poritis]|uniref:FAD-binding oxidoreductase n=1 Tax=Spartinivicinus poritis TaxID=2994640 RepID=A0ABT5UCZ7_9GAMM|nr:FAD-binding oxidoreductase [Spartinivicinus sp. A2-2]MDE1464253.1 FAD-binding oxidoreductase [Spartinivicinus sp. A2-2]
MTNVVYVNRMPKDTGPAAWNRILSPAQSYPPLTGTVSADWVIVGGGFTGMAAARRLSQLVPNDKVVMLEASHLAEGPAGRNSGFMIDLPHELNSKSYAGGRDEDKKQIRLNRAAINFARQMAHDFTIPQEVFDLSGKVTGAASARGEKHIDSYLKHIKALGEQYQLLDQAEMKALTGSDYYSKGLFTPGTAMIQPAAFIRLTAQGLSKDVAIYENSPVTEMQLGPEHTLKTPKGRVKTKRVILAVNGHIQSFGYFKQQLMHIFTYASMTRALNQDEVKRLGGEANWGLLPADPMGTTVRRTSNWGGSGERLTIRNHFTLNQSMEVSETELRNVAKNHDQAFKARFPMLTDVTMEYCWGGRLCLSLNSVPAFGELEERVYAAACQNGLGTVKGTLSGMMAVELATKMDSPILKEFMAYDAPSRLPPEPFMSLGTNAALRWKEWRAGCEV